MQNNQEKQIMERTENKKEKENQSQAKSNFNIQRHILYPMEWNNCMEKSHCSIR